MKKAIIYGVLTVLVLSVFAVAMPNFVPADVVFSNGKASVVIPEHAVEVAPGVFSLGAARDVDGRVVEGFMFIDNRKGRAKPGTECGNGICEAGENANKCPADCGGGEEPPAESTCFALFAKGARWKETEQYVTGSGIDTVSTSTSLETWDTEVVFDIFGTRDASGITDGADTSSPDGKNEVEFTELGANGPVAHTIVWGIFRGPPSGRELVEWDAEFNTVYNWSLSGEADKMDYGNVAVHEFGHALGLGHPSDGCTEETMYRFVALGETKKQTLEAGDIAGVHELY